jgi:hypothetical protein
MDAVSRDDVLKAARAISWGRFAACVRRPPAPSAASRVSAATALPRRASPALALALRSAGHSASGAENALLEPDDAEKIEHFAVDDESVVLELLSTRDAVRPDIAARPRAAALPRAADPSRPSPHTRRTRTRSCAPCSAPSRASPTWPCSATP